MDFEFEVIKIPFFFVNPWNLLCFVYFDICKNRVKKKGMREKKCLHSLM